MQHKDEKGEPNVVSLAEARKRQKTLQAARKLDGKGGRANGASRSPNKPMDSNGVKKVWGYLQVILFLLVVAYFMHLCQRGG